jgi:tetratricopeptide (TPR) repeat protein
VIAALLALGFSPLEAEEPHVRAGNERLGAGDPAGALARYGEAEAAVGARPEIAFDRGHALLRAGRLAEARDAWRDAARAAPPALASRSLQNAASALDALGDRDGAIEALREALLRDPGNADARYDLEVLLRRRPSGQAPGAQRPAGTGGGAPPPPAPGAGAPDPGKGPGPRPDEAPRPDGAARREEARREGAAGESPAEGAAGAAHGAAEPRPEIARQDAERLLDALRAREQNAPLWSRPAEARRRDAEKDW